MTEEINYLIVPGWQGSPEQHWQSYWHAVLPNAQRVEQLDWQNPTLEHWVAELQRSIERIAAPLVLIAHSLGCITVAHWAARADAASLDRVRGALLVAPADVERAGCPFPLRNFAPVPSRPLPFASLLVGSTNDPAATSQRALFFADNWGSQAVILRDAGHINVASGHNRWEQGFAWLYRLQEQAGSNWGCCA